MIPTLISKISTENDECSSSCFVEAKKFWEAFFQKHSSENLETLKESLGKAQFEFRHLFQDYSFAKEVMVLTAISFIYDQTNGQGFLKDYNDTYYDEYHTKLAQKTLKAFDNNSVSLEVKGQINKVKSVYNL